MLKNKNKKDVSTQVEDLTTQVADLDNKLRTALADYQNLKRELEKQHDLKTAMVKKRVFLDLIELFSDIFFAVEQLPVETQQDKNIAGVFLIMSKYHDLLKNHGVSEITFNEGDDYDAELAEVLSVVPHESLDRKVAQTIQPGYKIGAVMIKPARVMIYKAEAKEPEDIKEEVLQEETNVESNDSENK